MYVCTRVCLVPVKTRRGHQILQNRTTDSCESPSQGSLGEQPVLLATEPSLSSLFLGISIRDRVSHNPGWP